MSPIVDKAAAESILGETVKIRRPEAVGKETDIIPSATITRQVTGNR